MTDSSSCFTRENGQNGPINSLRFANLATGDLERSARCAYAQPGTLIVSVAIGDNAMTQQRGSLRGHAVEAGRAIRGGMARQHSGGMRPGKLNQCKRYPNAMRQGHGTASFVEKRQISQQGQSSLFRDFSRSVKQVVFLLDVLPFRIFLVGCGSATRYKYNLTGRHVDRNARRVALV